MSLTQVDFDIIMKRLDKFEEELKKLEKEIKWLQKQTPVPAVWPNDPTRVPKPYDRLGQIPCYFDNLAPEDRMKPMGISCPCPKCSPYSLSQGSLVDSGTTQEWRVAKSTDDVEE